MQSIGSLRTFLPSVSSMILFAERVLGIRQGLDPAWCQGYLKERPHELDTLFREGDKYTLVPDESLLCQLLELALDSFEGLGAALEVCSKQLTESELDRLDYAALKVYRDLPGYDRWTSWLHAEWDPERDADRWHARVRVKLLLTAFRTYKRKARDEGR